GGTRQEIAARDRLAPEKRIDDKQDALTALSAGLPLMRISKPTTMYHYTNKKGMDGIVNSGKLKPSLKANNPKDVRYGEGQYLSDIEPGTKSPAQLAKEFINVPNKYKYTNYVEIDVTGMEVIKGRDGVYVVPNTKDLDISDRIKSFGSVKKE
ncbi:MAG: HYD1 signature containing ADP-ribosyltransferase family protein, partial [Bacteroidota bacterium]